MEDIMVKTVAEIPGVGRVCRTGNKLVCRFSSSKLRVLFGYPVHEFTHWSDVWLMKEEMIKAASGFYGRFSTATFRKIVEPVPELEAGARRIA